MNVKQIPPEFLAENVNANSPEDEQLYTHLLKENGPLQRFTEQGLVFTPSPTGDNNGVDLDDDSLYYNTQGSAREYWEKNGPIPSPTKNIKQLRNDFREFGYCLIEEALSKEQLSTIRTRVVEQAAGERLAGVGFHYAGGAGTGKTTQATQFIPCLVNKGDCFQGFMEHNPEVVQSGPLIEQLLNETVGSDFIITSFLSIIASQGGHPQSLHQDSSEQLQTGAPLLCNHLVFLDDVNYFNGSTMIVPRSHNILSESGSHRPVQQLPPAISLEAKAGTIMMMDGRTLHGTGINQTEKPRHILVMACVKPWMRAQELFPFSLDSKVLANASLKLLKRLCFVGNQIGGIEGHGQEPGVLRGMRKAMDAGNYVRIGELSPSSSKEELAKDYTWRFTTTGSRAAMNQPEQRYPSGEPWESDDPVEQTPVDERHKVLQEATIARRKVIEKF